VVPFAGKSNPKGLSVKMKIMLLKDVYKLGRAGDVKKVANGYGRNYLIPQGLAVLATPGALVNAEKIRTEANRRRDALNEELGGLASQLAGRQFTFPVRASETGKLYGSVTTRAVAEAINTALGSEVTHRQIDSQPLRTLGEYTIPVRLTLDLAPKITVIVYREGESIESAYEFVETEEEEMGEVEDSGAEETGESAEGMEAGTSGSEGASPAEEA
jgi:large subunit ribosomal protein L9